MATNNKKQDEKAKDAKDNESKDESRPVNEMGGVVAEQKSHDDESRSVNTLESLKSDHQKKEDADKDKKPGEEPGKPPFPQQNQETEASVKEEKAEKEDDKKDDPDEELVDVYIPGGSVATERVDGKDCVVGSVNGDSFAIPVDTKTQTKRKFYNLVSHMAK